jgi:catechol 2,3-dioxygenase-like lactoylglutathione lyase family enzyme
MEHEIARLLDEFERGRLTRRQLIKSLAMAAVVAPATAAAQTTQPAAALAEKAPWKTVWLDHISYAVADYKKSAAFYSNLMGWEIRNDNGTNQATLNIGNIGQIIIRNRRQPDGNAVPAGGAAPAATDGRGQANRPPLTGVINHVSYGVAPWNTEKVKAELERRGLNPRPDMVGENFKSFHVLDPDGWDLQISNQSKID